MRTALLFLSMACVAATQEPADGVTARALLEQMRSALFAVEDAVSEARLEKDPKRRDDAVRRATRLGGAASDVATLASAVLERQEKLHAEMEKARGQGKPYTEPSIGAATLAALRGMLDRNREALRRALERLPAPSGVADEGGESAPIPEPSALIPPPSAVPAVPADPASLASRVRSLREEIGLAETWARDTYDRLKNRKIVDDAFARHGAVNKHGWAAPWADWLYVDTWAGIGGSRWEPLERALDSFASYLQGGPRAMLLESEPERARQESEYTRYLAGCASIWRRYHAEQRRLIVEIADVMGRRAAAGEAGDRKAYDALGVRRAELLKEFDREFPIRVKPWDDWRASMAASQAELDALRRAGREGMQLEPEHVRRLLTRVADRMKSRGLPSSWLAELAGTLPDMEYNEAAVGDEKVIARYYPYKNIVTLRPDTDFDRLADSDVDTLVHELFHAWHDMVPYWMELNLSEPENEAVASFLGTLAGGGWISIAFRNAAARKGASPRVAVEALARMDRYWKGDFLKRLRISQESDRAEWEGMKRDAALREQVERLEALLGK